LVGLVLLKAGLSQEKPEQLVGTPARSTHKPLHCTSLIILQFHVLLRCFLAVPLKEQQAACQGWLCALAALPADATHVDYVDYYASMKASE